MKVADLRNTLIHLDNGSWTHGTPLTAPVAGATLCTVVATASAPCLYGFVVSSEEENSFLLSWRSGGVAKTYRIPVSSSGIFIFRDLTPFLTADIGSAVTITTVNIGGAGIVYQASLYMGSV